VILVDSSVWIDFFSRRPGIGGAELRRMIQDGDPFAICGFVVTEVLQGLVRDATRIEHFLSQWDMLEPSGFDTYRTAANIFRQARSHGITLTTIDTLIAAIAQEQGAPVFTLDRDFSRITRITGLELYTFEAK
jgi:predicted nucleic acid-binding protein